MNCTICGEPVVLSPSAAERAAKWGNSAPYYTRLFTAHAACQLEKRKEETLALMRRLKRREETTRKAGYYTLR